MSYSFLAEFDLLRESREEVREKPWATAVAREALDAFFKTLRADEMLIQVSTEMVRLLTYMRDEDEYLKLAIELYEPFQPDIAHAIRQQALFKKRVHVQHQRRIRRIEKLSGYAEAVEDVERLKGRGAASAHAGVRAEHREGFELSALRARVKAAHPESARARASSDTDRPMVSNFKDSGDEFDDDDSDWEMADNDDEREPEEKAVDIALLLSELSLAGG